ncbi:putative membrane protein [Gottschalkia acidurici 9a]|uniref:Membrane protein n=1 Tax=Gottschalkia acidurici (strain ATCC 7906 / DSM 604 / BCRC 14475 / CIP 104303 / KCTC 5404 / NCIMB 10678 / 9a) TaxID=1128398 RepID=K0B2W3_GOTA9|nr:lysoplasmalogenase family protein [Gottschalkia acidurici]AFS79492.1 putative membrane protein [Gottschalkia acidurici 9a]
MRNKKYNFMDIKILLLAISFIYVLCLYIDFSNKQFFISIDIVKYISILLCFIISLLIGKRAISVKDRCLLQVGLLFTVLADLCLLILGYFKLGVAFFCITQIVYFFRYKVKVNFSIIMSYMKILSIILIVCLSVNYFWLKADIIIPISIFYFICLLNSIIESLKLLRNKRYPYPNAYMIAIGMILFLLCDINVGLYNISRAGNFQPWLIKVLRDVSYPLIWLFYLPSQVLLSLSGFRIYDKRY